MTGLAQIETQDPPGPAVRRSQPAASQEPARARPSAVSAGGPFLAAKITAPTLPDWLVRRPRITELIEKRTRWYPLTVLTGPPGAGKTMALALWAAANPGPVAWVGLDEYDDRPEVFWSYVVAALGQSGAVPAKQLPAATQGRTGDHVFLLRLAAALANQDRPVTLVLDDLHLLAEPKVLGGLDFVLRNTGSGLRLAVSCRMDPLLPLHRYRLAGQLSEIRAADLAFSAAEAGLLLAQHGITLRADALDSLMRRTEGWAAGLRLAVISLAARPDPDQFVKELSAEDSALTGYLVDEVLNAQPPQVREVLLCTSVLDRVNPEAATALAGDERAAGIFSDLARTNAFIQPAGSGWYRYHPLLAEVLRLKLRHEFPGRMASLHHGAARWHERHGELADAVRHAARAGDWPLAAAMVVDDLAIGLIIDPRSGQRLAGKFAGMPADRAWAEPEPHLVRAAMALSAGRAASCAAALAAADAILERLIGDQRAPARQAAARQAAARLAAARLAAEMIRLACSLDAGDLDAAAQAVARAEMLLGQVPDDKLARHPEIKARVLSGRGTVELCSGNFDEAVRVLLAGMSARTAPAGPGGPAECTGHLALAEALRGRLRRAAKLAAEATAPGSRQPRGRPPDPAALVALAWVHLERNELREAGIRLKQAEAALAAGPDKLIGTVACLAAAAGALADGRAAVAAQIIDRARSGWRVPAWLDRQLSLVQSRARAASRDIPAAIAAAERAGSGTTPEVAVAITHAWLTAGDRDHARRALTSALASDSGVPDRVRVQALLADARLSYTGGDRGRGYRSLTAALRLAEPEQLRLPFAMERSWIGSVLRRDPALASTHRDLLGPGPYPDRTPAPPGSPDQLAIPAAEPLSGREREVLHHLSGMLSTAEVASEMSISVNTVKTHLRNVYRKLAASHRGEAVRRARQLGLI